VASARAGLRCTLLLLAAAAAAAALASCGAPGAIPPPPAQSAAERAWIANADSLVGVLDNDVLLSTAGGGNLASARRALHDGSAVYTMLVAYELFGDCGSALANAGTPSGRAARAEGALIAACARLERASTLFQRAMTRRDAASLLEASRTVLRAVPDLSAARADLDALGGSA